ncbi:MAG: hypothetical protein ACRDHZ_23170, partial [Ktedonobacteraceae bacterium]
MEQVSTSQRLQNAVLRVTARDNSSLDFTRTGRRKAFYGALPEGTVSLGQHVLVLGIPDESTLQFTAREIGSSGTIRLVEHQKALLERGREYTTPLEKQLGYCNWSFEHAPLDDLSTDPAFLASSLAEQPVTNVQAYQDLHEALNVQRSERPWIATGKTDVVIIDQAVNRIVASQIKPLLAEAWRVLTPGGHLVLRLLLADEHASIDLPKMPDGTVFLSIPHETEIATLLQQGGYYGIRYTWRGDLPVKVIHGVEVRSFVIEAYKQEAALQLDRGHAVVYRGPWKV